VLGFHPVTRHDGAMSVRRAYSPEELAGFASEAGLSEWRLDRHLFSRMTLAGRVDTEGEAAR